MAKQTISVTRALVELKRYEQRLHQALAQGTFAAVSYGEAEKTRVESVNRQRIPSVVKDVETLITSSFQSVNDLITNRAALKAAIVASNAATKVKFLDREISVAEAIETKSSLTMLRTAQTTMNNQVVQAVNTVAQADAKLKVTIETLTGQALGGSGKADASAQEAIAMLQNAAHRPQVIGHEVATKNLQALQERISAIEAELDFTLSESNAKTLIEVDM